MQRQRVVVRVSSDAGWVECWVWEERVVSIGPSSTPNPQPTPLATLPLHPAPCTLTTIKDEGVASPF